MDACHTLHFYQLVPKSNLRLKIQNSYQKRRYSSSRSAMDIRIRFGSLYSNLSKSISSNHKILKPCCNSKNPPPRQNGDSNNNSDNLSTDWDKAWTNFKKQGKKSLLSGFSPNKYVTWNPRRSEFPLSEEVDPIKRSERTNLMLWTSPRFTLGVAILIVTFLLVYTILAPVR